jgi:hypothetical protein
MEEITNEVWLQLEDGRLISMNRIAAQGMIGEGRATLIPPERVVRDGPLFKLVEEKETKEEPKATVSSQGKAPAKVETAAVEPPEKRG